MGIVVRMHELYEAVELLEEELPNHGTSCGRFL
jgi:hypothetical protein